METQEQELQLKRTAAKMSREVKKFWLRINQVITFKQKLEADEARQKVNSRTPDFRLRISVLLLTVL